jgi:hypothetical protein
VCMAQLCRSTRGVTRFRSIPRSFLGRDRDTLSHMECKAIATHPFAVTVEEQLWSGSVSRAGIELLRARMLQLEPATCP